MSEDLERRVLGAVTQHAAAGLLPAAALTAGLKHSEFDALFRAVGLPPAVTGRADAAPAQADDRPALLSPLIALIWAQRSSDGPWTRLMAGAIASAAFGARHLWQDLGATGRPEVTALLVQHFPGLAARNVRNLKWKNHLFQCLGAELGLADLRPPRCDGCEEQPLCFPEGPKEVVFRIEHGGSAAKEKQTT